MSISDSRSAVNSLSTDPPAELAAEQALLGALMLNNRMIDRAGAIEPGDFFDPLHAHLFEMIRQRVTAGRIADATTIASAMDGGANVGPWTAPQYVRRLVTLACLPAAIKDYARTIVEASVKRRLIIHGEDAIAAARSGAGAAESLAAVEKSLYAIGASNQQDDRAMRLGEAIAAAEQLARAAALRGDALAGLSTGLRDLDAKLGGLQPSDLVVLAGRPAMGKSALATNIAFAAALRGTPVDFYSQEMSAVQLGLRILGEQAGVSSDLLRRGKAMPAAVAGLSEHVARLSDVAMVIDETGALTLPQIVQRARRRSREMHTGLIVIDYLQLMQGTSRLGNRNQDITEITTGLKALAKELDVPIIALSQLSRGPETRTDKRPQLSDLRESGSIEQDADVVLFVFRDEYYILREEPKQTDYEAYADWQARMHNARGMAEVIIAKQRHGPTGVVKLAFNGDLTKFGDLAREAEHAAA